MWKKYNPNPAAARVGDCTVRAIAKATGCDWETAYIQLCVQGFMMADMPSANAVWGAYLKRMGFHRAALPNDCPDCYSVEDFARDHPRGIYVLGLSKHVVCVEDGDYYDAWDSGAEIPVYYWCREA